jgi:hypothetical protein
MLSEVERQGKRRIRAQPPTSRSRLDSPRSAPTSAAFGIVAIFVSIPNANVIYAVAGLVIYGGFTTFDFSRLRRSSPDAAVPIAAGIFLDVFSVFVLFLDLFGGRGD